VVSGLNGIEASEAFRMLRAQVMQRLESANASTLAITSAGADEGKTLVAANLAVSLSRLADRRVLLVDVDLRRPAMHSVFGLSPTKGLAHHLLQNAPLADCLISPGLDGLVLLPCGTGGEMSSELLSSPAMARLVEELKDRYSDRIVLYDLPPLLLTDDAFMFLKHVDACLLVVEQGSTRREEIERCLELLQEFNVIGTVLNKARSPQGGYGYGYGY
jgi:capsular exopolysaccharide synthesis family protein